MGEDFKQTMPVGLPAAVWLSYRSCKDVSAHTLLGMNAPCALHLRQNGDPHSRMTGQVGTDPLKSFLGDDKPCKVVPSYKLVHEPLNLYL